MPFTVRLFFSLIVSLLLSSAFFLEAEENTIYHPLLISSSISEHASLEVKDAFEATWQERNKSLALIYQNFPNTGEDSPAAEVKRETIELMAARLEGNTPDIIVAHLNDALDLAVAFRRDYCPDVPIIAVEVHELKYNEYKGTPLLYWVEMPRHDLANIRFALRLLPDLKHIVIMIKDPLPKEVQAYYVRELSSFFPDVEFHLIIDPSIEKADEMLKDKKEGTAIINMNPGWINEEGVFLSGKEFIRDLVRRYDLPVFEFLRQDLGSGLMGGVGLVRSNIGKAAAELSLRLIIDQEPLPKTIDWPGLASNFADYTILKKHGSKLDMIPNNTEIINLPPPFWTRYKRPIQIFAFLMFISLIFLLFNVRIKREKEKILSDQNRELEATVALRTRELQTSNEELSASNTNLQETLQRVENMQDELVMKEREALLGRLTAGIAHELNSPLAAIRSANESQRYVFLEGSLSLPKVIFSLSHQQRRLYEEMIPCIHPDTAEVDSHSLEDRIKRMGVDVSPAVLQDIVSAGFSGLDDRLLRPLIEKENQNLVKALFQYSTTVRSIDTIETAVARSDLVITSIREYISAHNQSADTSPVDVEKTIQSALDDLKRKWPKSIRVVKVLDAVPRVLAVEHLLEHVWVQIIKNAVQAMPQGGTLTIQSDFSEGFVRIHIKDEGVGIDPGIEEQIFDPFITTRPYAEGLGLGLAYCRKILEIMDGSITYVKENKGTTFTVTLKADMHHES